MKSSVSGEPVILLRGFASRCCETGRRTSHFPSSKILVYARLSVAAQIMYI